MTAFKYVDDVFLSAWLVLSGTGWLCTFPFFHHLLFSHSFCPSLFSCSYWNKRQKKLNSQQDGKLKPYPFLSSFNMCVCVCKSKCVWVCPSMSPCVCCDIIIPLPPPGHYRLRRTCSGSISLWSEHLLSLTLQTVEEAFGLFFFFSEVCSTCAQSTMSVPGLLRCILLLSIAGILLLSDSSARRIRGKCTRVNFLNILSNFHFQHKCTWVTLNGHCKSHSCVCNFFPETFLCIKSVH